MPLARIAALEAHVHALQDQITSMVESNTAYHRKVEGFFVTLGDKIAAVLSTSEHGHVHHEQVQTEPTEEQVQAVLEESFKVIFSLNVTPNAMFKMYIESHDHPVNPNGVVLMGREHPDQEFAMLEANDGGVSVYLADKYRSTCPEPNQWSFVELYRVTDTPVDESSVLTQAK